MRGGAIITTAMAITMVATVNYAPACEFTIAPKRTVIGKVDHLKPGNLRPGERTLLDRVPGLKGVS